MGVILCANFVVMSLLRSGLTQAKQWSRKGGIKIRLRWVEANCVDKNKIVDAGLERY